MSRAFHFDVQSDSSLVLTLDGACVQSKARQAHREITDTLLDCNSAQDTTLQALVELLREFLSSQDFAALRTRHPELNGTSGCRVRIYRHDDGAVCWEVVSSE